jgi:hypothetical protein
MGTTLAILITVIAIFVGTLTTYLVVVQTTLPTRLCAGAVLGLAAYAWLCFLLALLLGLNLLSILGALILLTFGALVLWRKVSPARFNADLRATNRSTGEIVYYAAWTALLIFLFSRVVMYVPNDGLHTSPANNYGDLPFHLSVITSFAYGNNLPPENPIFAGGKFTYPFLIDFLTAVFIRLGADWRVAFFLENLALGLALIGLLNFLTYRLTNNRLAARLAPVIFLFNGGLGFLNFFQDLGQEMSKPASNFFALMTHLPRTYTMNAELLIGAAKYPLRWGNVFTTLLIPQRSMLFGLPLVAMIIALWWMAWGEGEMPSEDRKRHLIAAGVLAGFLPMLHAHGFFAVMLASVAMALLFFSLEWLFFFLPAGVIALPQALYLSGTGVRSTLFKPHLWWETGEGNSPLIFWAVNAGVFIVLLLLGWGAQKLSTAGLRKFYLPFLIWFILPNVVLLAPWPWDNIKVLIYWALASVPLVALAIAFLWQQSGAVARLVAAIAVVLLTLSGGLDVLRAASPAENVGLYSQADLNAATAIINATPPRARVLHAPIHNSVIALTGRQSLMGYPGHLWTHGIDYGSRETEVQTIYKGGAIAMELMSKHKIDFVVIGPVERANLQPDENFFATSYAKVVDESGYRVYRIKQNGER